MVVSSRIIVSSTGIARPARGAVPAVRGADKLPRHERDAREGDARRSGGTERARAERRAAAVLRLALCWSRPSTSRSTTAGAILSG